MLRLPLTGMTMSNPQNGHHACDISAHGALSIPKAPGWPSGLTCFTLNAGHYHYSGPASVTAAAWKCASGRLNERAVAFTLPAQLSPYPLLAS